MNTFYTSNAHVPGARQLSERDKEVTLRLPMDQLTLTRECQPLAPGSWLADALVDVLAGMDSLDYGDGFADSVTSLLSAIRSAIPVLEAQTTEPDASIDEIVADLERALLVSLVVTLTAHTAVTPKADEWNTEHQRYLDGKRPDDLGHYLEIRTLSFANEPRPGRVHMQHVRSACDAGMSVFVVGAAGIDTVQHHPEVLTVTYAQWFTYMFALWEEQFRGRLAKYWDSQLDGKIRRSDILVDYFGDIRLVRNDFVHNKGICKESASTMVLRWNFIAGQPIEITPENLITLIPFFPKHDLRTPPIPRPSSGLVGVPGRIDAQLLEDAKDRAAELGLSENELVHAVFSQWLAGAATP